MARSPQIPVECVSGVLSCSVARLGPRVYRSEIKKIWSPSLAPISCMLCYLSECFYRLENVVNYKINDRGSRFDTRRRNKAFLWVFFFLPLFKYVFNFRFGPTVVFTDTLRGC